MSAGFRVSPVRLACALLAFASVIGVGCGDEDASPASVPVEDAAANTVDATTTTAEVSTPVDDSSVDAPRDARDAARTIACTIGDDCHEGRCFEGICVCNDDAFIQPDGTCGPTPPLNCTQQGATCRVRRAVCLSGETAGELDPSCGGGTVPAICCFTCAGGPDDLVCCPLDANEEPIPSAPICVWGWRTCKKGFRPEHGGADASDACRR